MSAWEVAKTKDLDALAAEVFGRMDGVSDSDPLSPWADLALALIERCKETRARAHAEGLEAGLREAWLFLAKEPLGDVPVPEMKRLMAGIRSLIPEVIK